jgi:TrmH RNA methyltransferase
VSELFKAAPERVDRLYFEPALRAQMKGLCTALAKVHKQYREVEPAELERLAGTAMHGGVVALAAPRAIERFDLAEAARWAKAGEPLLMLDGIGNPHNLGAIARTAAFFGLQRIVLSDHPGQAGPSDASYRIAKGGLEHVALYRAERFATALRRLEPHYLVLAAGLEGGRPLEEHLARVPGKPAALVLGNEEEGLPPSTRQAAAGVVTIPGAGRMQSLNVAAAAAILIAALVRPLPARAPRVRSGS